MRPGHGARRGALVAVTPSAPLAAYLAKRHYLPRGVPLLKHVAAVAGQRVCRNHGRITVDGKALGYARPSDRIGRPLLAWRGCHRLGSAEIFLMNAQVPDSLDGRYFGVTPIAAVLGQLTPLWVRDDAEGRRNGARTDPDGANALAAKPGQ